MTRSYHHFFLQHVLPAAAVLAAAVLLLFPPSAAGDDTDDLIAGIVSKTSSPSEAAGKLMHAAGMLGDAPAVQMRVCAKAYECGVKSPSGYTSAVAALDLLAKLAPKQAGQWQLRRLELYRLRYERGPTKDRAANGLAYVRHLVKTAPSGTAGDAAKLIRIVTAGARNNADRASLLVAAAAELAVSPRTQAIFYDKALEYGAKTPLGCTQALAAISALMKLSPTRAAELQEKRVEVLRLRYRSSRKAAARKAAGASFMPALVARADTLTAGRRAVEAVALYYEAIGLAIYLKSSSARASIAGKLKAAEKQAMVERKLAALQDAIKKAPDNTEIRTQLVLFYLHELNDPAGAAKYLTAALDEALRTYVPLAEKPVEQIAPAKCLELGQWYYGQFAKASPAGKPVVLTRAMRYYERCLAETKTTDVQHLKATLAMKDIQRHLGAYGRHVVIHWNMADDADVYLNGKPLRKVQPTFHTRRDEAYKRYSAKAILHAGDVFTVGGRRGGSYGFLLVALDKQGRTVWQTDTKNWQAYTPADLKKWYLPSVAARSKKTKVTVNPRPWHVQNTMRKQLRVTAQSIWPGSSVRRAYLVSVVR